MNQNMKQTLGSVSEAILSSMRVCLNRLFGSFVLVSLSLFSPFLFTLSPVSLPLLIFLPSLPFPLFPLPSHSSFLSLLLFLSLSSSPSLPHPLFLSPLVLPPFLSPCPSLPFSLQECQTATFQAIKMDLTPANYHGHLAFNPDQEPYQVCYDMMRTFSSVEYEDRTIYYPLIKQWVSRTCPPV